MNLWALLMVVLFLLTIGGVLYLANRIGQFAFIRKLAKGKKRIPTLIGFLIAAAVTAVIWLAWGSMNAIICILHLVVFWLISDLIFKLIQKYGHKSFTRYYAGAAAIIFTVCYLAVGWYQAHHVWETTYEIHSDKKVGNLRVAVLSDSHTGTTFHGEGFAEHIKEIEAQNPDVLLIAELEKNNVHVMQDDVELVDDRFYIIGRKDKSEEYSGGRKTMEELTKDLDPDKFSIVLDHQPQDYDAQAASGVDLVLSGHTHGGQLFPLMTIENHSNLAADDRVYGYEKRENTNFIVTSGISDWAIKFKTGCKSEYLMLLLDNM